ncbi:MAG: Clp protease ClpP [Paludibacteraceae bacterium]|nr:Clp protease ClpP [Paludibacteraceae bacterium]
MKYDLYLRGYVGGADFDSDLVSRTLTKYKDRPVTVLIDSLGGSLATALSIAAAFREHGDVTAHFVGMNASAATIASMGANSITIDECAMYLVHKCSAEFFQWASFNADQLQDQIDQLTQLKSDLEKMDLNVAQMYARKCKKPVADLLALMKTGGWLTANEAWQWGFVDCLTDNHEDAVPVLTEDLAASMQANGLPLPNMEIKATPTPTGFHKLVEMLSNFFQRKPETNAQPDSEATAQEPTQHTNQLTDTDMTKLLPLLATALALQAQEFTLKDDHLQLTAEQADTLEAYIKDLSDKLTAEQTANKTAQDRIKALEKQLADKPADETVQVINQPAQSSALSAEAEFVANLKKAQELFDSLP